MRKIVNFIRQFLGFFSAEKFSLEQNQALPEIPQESEEAGAVGHIVPYDESLLERSRLQWQFGDWESLRSLDRDVIQHHPDRAKLALLAASAHQQGGNMELARVLIQLARDWGCGRRLIGEVLIAGVHNSLGRAAALNGQMERARLHFEGSIRTVTPGADLRLITQARTQQQLIEIGLIKGDSMFDNMSPPQLR